jgi:hypothetical protein
MEVWWVICVKASQTRYLNRALLLYLLGKAPYVIFTRHISYKCYKNNLSIATSFDILYVTSGVLLKSWF